MKIKEIIIYGLFGMFDYKISLNTDITIIHGANGVGKTKILELLDNLLNENLSGLGAIPFKQFIIKLEDDNEFSITRENELFCFKTTFPTIFEKEITWKAQELDEKVIFLLNKGIQSKPNSSNSEEILNWLANFIQDIASKIDIKDFLHGVSKLDKVIQEIQSREKTISWLQQVKLQINLSSQLLKIHRLLFSPGLKFKILRSPRLLPNLKSKINHENLVPINTIRKYSEHLKEQIRFNIINYGRCCEKLDRSFPNRLLEQNDENILSTEKIFENISILETLRSKLANVQIFKENFYEIIPKEKICEKNQRILSLYIQDNIEKLSLWEKLINKIQLLLEVINANFLYKKLKINMEDGFCFISQNGDRLTPEKLSSGEQHILILFYHLLFCIEHNTLVLIDEPELSLHVEWQRDFIDTLNKVINLQKNYKIEIQILIATHSPQIISDHWDITVDLMKELENDCNSQL